MPIKQVICGGTIGNDEPCVGSGGDVATGTYNVACNGASGQSSEHQAGPAEFETTGWHLVNHPDAWGHWNLPRWDHPLHAVLGGPLTLGSSRVLPLLAILHGKVVGNGTCTIAVLRGRQVLSTGKAAEVMIEPSLQHRVSLVVMATHDPNGVGRWPLGSIAERVLHRMQVPVLIIRASIEMVNSDGMSTAMTGSHHI